MGGPILPETLPSDVGVLHQMLRALASDLERLNRQFELLRRHTFGRRREAFHPGQQSLEFAESPAEEAAPTPPQHVEEAPDAEEPHPGPRPKPKHGRRPLPPELPRERVELLPPAEERSCRKCGHELVRIGEEVSEVLDYRPASFLVRQQVRVKLGCRACEAGVVIAPPPPRPIEKGRPGAGLLAQVIVAKYADHLPLHRQESIFQRHGVQLCRSTLCDWVRDAADLLRPIVAALKRAILATKLIQSDDTPIKVQDATAVGGSRPGYLWVYRSLECDAVYDYTARRSRDGPQRFLAGYEGYLQVDAYPGFDAVLLNGKIVEVGCWAHARRRFFEAQGTSALEAAYALVQIGRLYALERKAQTRELAPEDRRGLRQEQARPLLVEFHDWLERQAKLALPKSPLGDALGYALRQWTPLTRYLEDGRLPIDNNGAERALRRVAVGRNNWIFAGSDQGGERAAIHYSLVQTCKENGIDPWEYLTDVLEPSSALPRPEQISRTMGCAEIKAYRLLRNPVYTGRYFDKKAGDLARLSGKPTSDRTIPGRGRNCQHSSQSARLHGRNMDHKTNDENCLRGIGRQSTDEP